MSWWRLLLPFLVSLGQTPRVSRAEFMWKRSLSRPPVRRDRRWREDGDDRAGRAGVLTRSSTGSRFGFTSSWFRCSRAQYWSHAGCIQPRVRTRPRRPQQMHVVALTSLRMVPLRS